MCHKSEHNELSKMKSLLFTLAQNSDPFRISYFEKKNASKKINKINNNILNQ